METFIHQVVKDISKEELPLLKDYSYVFPSRRSGKYFRDYLTTAFSDEAFILPSIYSIQDFILTNAAKSIPDDIVLLGKLYLVASKYVHETFEQFQLWGEMILDDFDEIDKYLVDASLLFKTIELQKEIDAGFELEEEHLQLIRQFWKNVDTPSENPLKENFLATWKVLGNIYKDFNDHLDVHNEAYEGKAYRWLLHELKQGKTLPYKKLVFAGFNALSTAEEELFKHFQELPETLIYWDTCAHYEGNKYHEAGNFIRHYRKLFNTPANKWIEQEKLINKRFRFIGTPLKISQVLTANMILEEKTEKSTALILCDEHLLQPLLYRLPDMPVNITMGVPLKNSMWHSAMLSLLDVIRSKRGGIINFDNIYTFLQQPALAGFVSKEELMHAEALLSRNKTQDVGIRRLVEEVFSQNTLMKMVLNSPVDTVGFTMQIEKIIFLFLSNMTMEENPQEHLFLECIYEKVRQFHQLIFLLNEPPVLSTYARLLKQFLQKTKIPFEHASTEGLQIMGFLESRSLDFERVIILSANEGKLPAGNKRISFIPYNLRKSFRLPTFTERDAIYAYHFYRLLQRAEDIVMVYDTEKGEDVSEKSRFIAQLLLELDKSANNIEVLQTQLEKENSLKLNTIAAIPKNAAIMEKLANFVFSATSLSEYIRCPLSFYLHYIAEIPEIKDTDIQIDPRTMGIILHKFLEENYRPYKDNILTKEAIATMLDDEVIMQKMHHVANDAGIKVSLEQASGKNILIKLVIRHFITNILRNDLRYAPFTPIYLEESFRNDQIRISYGAGKSIQLTGNIDRVDAVEDGEGQYYRILDYKTGKVELPVINKQTDARHYMERFFSPKYHYAFQGMVYALLMRHRFPKGRFKVGFYSLRNTEIEPFFLNGGKCLETEHIQCFQEQLTDKIAELMNPDIPFYLGSNNAKDYEYSPWKDILGLEV
ncbi:MAG: PD-(D/E)XK nuclease family protein [Chitinophagales bacterium]|nr:PD-(D/E)XK nuclease family protein [Chitinophagales bacterium]